jgi:tetratricopeptide (TPR) repeat protein
MTLEQNSKIAREFCEQKRWHELLEFAKQWCVENPADSKAYYYLGVAYGALGQFTQAETAYRRALDIEPNDAKTWNNLAGLLYENLQRPVDGIRCIQQALKINPLDKLGWSNLATMVGRLGHHDRAMEFADRALALDAQLVEAHLHKGAAALALGKKEILKEVCETLEKLEPEKFRRAR